MAQDKQRCYRFYDDYDFVLEHARRRLLQAEKCSFWKQYEKGSLAYHAASTLIHNVNGIVAQSGRFFGIQNLQRHWAAPTWIRKLHDVRGLQSIAQQALVWHFSFGYAIALGFVTCAEEISQVCCCPELSAGWQQVWNAPGRLMSRLRLLRLPLLTMIVLLSRGGGRARSLYATPPQPSPPPPPPGFER